MEGCCLEECHRVSPDTDMKDYSKEERKLEEDRRGHAPKIVRNTTEEAQIYRHREKMCLTNITVCHNSKQVRYT
jgi:hypothetical protein